MLITYLVTENWKHLPIPSFVCIFVSAVWMTVSVATESSDGMTVGAVRLIYEIL